MVLVYYRAETNIHLWMKSTTSFALCFQEARLLDASHKERLNMTLRKFTFIAAPPRGTQDHLHCHGNSTLQFATEVQIVSMSLSLFIRHY